MRLLTVAFLCVSITAVATAQYPGAKRVPGEWRTGFNSITVADAKPILNWLAGPQFNGRNADSGDFFAAAGWVSGCLRDMGLEPGGDKGSYLQRFAVVNATAVPTGSELRSDDGQLKFPYGPEFAAGALEDIAVPVKFAFIHAGKDADISKLDWNLLKGRWVLMTRESNDNVAMRDKYLTGSRDSGALYWQIPTDRAGAASTVNMRAVGVKGVDDPQRAKFTSPVLKASAAEAIAKKSGATKYLAKSATEASIELSDVPFTVQVKVTKDEKPATNVVGILRGTDPTLKDECIVIGSHLDHLGVSDRGTRFGADDNGSGCTGNLLIARAMMRNEVKPKRTIVFIFYDHEETGLYGSFYYVNKPAMPIEKTVACFNMDMIGRNENRGPEIADNNVDAVYPGIVQLNSPELYELVVKANSYVNLHLKPDREDRTFRTDTGNYVRKGVPTIKVFTGEHEDYHQIGDTVDKINWDKLTNVAKWVYLSVQDLASSSFKPKFVTKTFTLLPYHILEGHANLKEAAQLPKNAILQIDLVDGSSKVLATYVKKQFPAGGTFEFLVDKKLVPSGGTYNLLFKIIDGTKTLYVNEAVVPMASTGWLRGQDVTMIKAP